MPRGTERVCDSGGRPLGPRFSAVPAFTARRVELGLSLERVAGGLCLAGLQTSFQAVASWEAGTYLPTTDRIVELAAILRVSEDEAEGMFYAPRVAHAR